MSIEWVDDLPPITGRGSPIAKNPVAVACRENPGRWAILVKGRKFSSGAQSWRKAGFEVANRPDGNGTYTIYVRWPATTAAAVVTPIAAAKPSTVVVCSTCEHEYPTLPALREHTLMRHSREPNQRERRPHTPMAGAS